MSPGRPDLAAQVREVRFTPVRLREAYDIGQVDQLLDELEAALTAGRPVGQMVEAARFSPVRLREGYVMDEVDDFLAEMVRLSTDQLSTDQASPPGSATASSTDTTYGPSFPVETAPPTSPTPSVITEQRGFISRLFGRNP